MALVAEVLVSWLQSSGAGNSVKRADPRIMKVSELTLSLTIYSTLESGSSHLPGDIVEVALVEAQVSQQCGHGHRRASLPMHSL